MRSRWRVAVTAVALLGAVLTMAAIDPAEAAGDKTTICHATASNTNPWVKITVSNNALPAHYGQVGNSHQRQRALGRFDFEWTPAFDDDCRRIAHPIRVSCPDLIGTPIIAVGDPSDVQGTSQQVPCILSGEHAYAMLPVGVEHIVCREGTAAVPARVDYRLSPSHDEYGVNCLQGLVVHLGIQGGPFQVLCPAEGAVTFYDRALFFGPPVRVPYPCTPGNAFPEPTTPDYGTVVDWTVGRDRIWGEIECPAAGRLELFFTDGGPLAAGSGDFHGYACTPGQPVEVTRLQV